MSIAPYIIKLGLLRRLMSLINSEALSKLQGPQEKKLNQNRGLGVVNNVFFRYIEF